MNYVFGSPEMVCRYDHENGPCANCGAIGKVGWTHECYECFHERLRRGMYGDKADLGTDPVSDDHAILAQWAAERRRENSVGGGDLDSFAVTVHDDGILLTCLICRLDRLHPSGAPLLKLVRDAEFHAMACDPGDSAVWPT